jgi:hypothetical protein
MSSAKTHIQSIINAVENLGYTYTDEFFDFNTYPTSGNNEIYRTETKTREAIGQPGKRVEKRKRFYIWVAFKLETGSDRKQDFYNAVDAVEDLEDQILQALIDIEVKFVENSQFAIKNDYIVVKLIGEFVYWRDLTSV